MVKHTSWHPPGNSSSLQPEYGALWRQWLAKPVGQHFLKLECERLNAIMPTLFGYEAVIIGEANFAAGMQASTIKNRYVINDDLNFTPQDDTNILYARRDRLPIATGSVDVVYLAHCLELATNPHEVLREAHRILRSDGQLVLSMLNTMSSWGLLRSMGKYSSNVLWKANFMSVVKLKDWLALLGFDIIRVNYFGYNLPFNKSAVATDLSLFERYGQKIELPIGAAFIIQAAKRVIPMTPLPQTWRRAPDLNEDDLTEPTA